MHAQHLPSLVCFITALHSPLIFKQTDRMAFFTGADKYIPDKLPELEAYVDKQASSDEYDLDANLAVLRHYQFSPSLCKISILAKVLLKALVQLPRTDFHTCVMLVPERLLSDETVVKLLSLATALETTRFADFWTLASGSKDLIALVSGFEKAVRRYILHVLGITFQKVHKKVLSSSLQLEGAALDALIAENVKESGWQVSSDIVTLPRNELNSPVVVKRTELIRFEQVAPVLRYVTTSF